MSNRIKNKKLLFFGPDHVGICKFIQAGFEKYSDFDVTYFDNHSLYTSFRYKNKLHRTQNFFLKTFFNRNLKTIYYTQKIQEVLNRNQGMYDVIFILRPDIVKKRHLLLLRKKAKFFVAYFWDSLAAYPNQKKTISFFDKIFSYEQEDCKNYGFEFLSNFHDFEQTNDSIEYDVYNMSTNDNRIFLIEQIAQYLEKKNRSFLFKGNGNKTSSPYVKTFNGTVPYHKMLQEIQKARIILDIQKDVQKGLSFRPFEALGLEKKLITNNPTIREYDFYDPQNIYVIEDNRIEIPDSFFETPYKKLPVAIVDQYHLKNWVGKIIEAYYLKFPETAKNINAH